MSNRVVVFEDALRNFEHLSREASPKLLPLDCNLVRFEPKALPIPSSSQTKDFGASLTEFLLSSPSTLLVVLDEDLVEYEGVVSRSAVHGACNEARIPVALYHFITGRDEHARRIRRWGESVIMIDNSEHWSEIGTQCASIAKGVLTIRQALEQNRGGSLAEIIPRMMGAPTDAEIQLNQYRFFVDQSVDASGGAANDSLRVVSTAILYWIQNQVLQFPGVLLNAVAAASHLDIDHEQFSSRPEIQGPFKEALYVGPLVEMGPFWWTTKLDDILAARTPLDSKSVITGHDLLEQMNISASRSRCMEGHDGSGYYCIIERRPVCIDHSVEPQGWLPAGATMSRIYRKTYDGLAPWKVF